MQAASLQSRNERRRAPNLSFLYPIDLTCKSPDCRSAGDPPRAAWDPSPWVGGTPRQGPGGLLRKFAKSALRLAIGGSDGRRGSGWAMPAGGPWSDRIGDRPPTRVRARGVSVWEGVGSADRALARVRQHCHWGGKIGPKTGLAAYLSLTH